MIYKNKFLMYKIIVLLICVIINSFFIGIVKCNAKEREAFFYINNVTPFNDLNNLIEEIDYLKDNGIKFFIEVSPVFVNEDLKSMGKFAECLRYAQTNGGRVVLKFPIVNNKGVSDGAVRGQMIYDKVKKAFNNYTNYWVYPVSMSVSESFLYNEELKNLFNCTDTLFLDSEDDVNRDVNNYSINSNINIVSKINLDNYIENRNTYSECAICIESDCDFKEFKKNVDRAIHKEINFTSNNRLNSSMKFDNEVRATSKGTFFNNEDVTQERFVNEEEYKSTFAQKNKEESPVKTDLTQTNRKLEILSGVALCIFLIILIISKNIERKRFFK